MVEMTIYGVSFDLIGKQPIVLLKTADGNRYLPIWIGHPEAAAILMKLQGTDAARPLTHDLLVNLLTELDVDVVRVTVTELRENSSSRSLNAAKTSRSSCDICSRRSRTTGSASGSAIDATYPCSVTAASSATRLNDPCSTMPGSTLSVCARSHASTQPKIAMIG